MQIMQFQKFCLKYMIWLCINNKTQKSWYQITRRLKFKKGDAFQMAIKNFYYTSENFAHSLALYIYYYGSLKNGCKIISNQDLLKLMSIDKSEFCRKVDQKTNRKILQEYGITKVKIKGVKAIHWQADLLQLEAMIERNNFNPERKMQMIAKEAGLKYSWKEW